MDKGDKTERDYNYFKEFSSKISELTKQIESILQNTDYKTMDTFKPYIKPKKNVSKLLEFYSVYTEVTKSVGDIKIEIEKSGIDLDQENTKLNIKDLNNVNIIDKIDKINEIIERLVPYKGVKIVDEFKSESEKYIKKIIKILEKVFFKALDRLPKVVSGLEEYSRLLLKYVENKTFLSEYTEILYTKLSFQEAKNLNTLIQETKDLTKYFNIIIDMNIKILGRHVAHNINVGVINLIVINLKKVIIDQLSVIDKDNKAIHVPLLIKLYGNLRHTKGPIIREIESLFIFRSQINKLILNCLIQFFCDLELVNKPSAKHGIEEFNLIMTEILQAFDDNKECKHIWVEEFGPSMGVYRSKDLNSNFCNKCLIKTAKLSEGLDGIPKYVYLINNYYIFSPFIKEFDSKELKSLIEKNIQYIIGMWKINTSSLQGSKLKKFIFDEISVHKKYKLPENQRIALIDAVKNILESLISSGMLQGSSYELVNEVERLYSGDE